MVQQTACQYLKKCALESLLKTGHWSDTPCISIPNLISFSDPLHIQHIQPSPRKYQINNKSIYQAPVKFNTNIMQTLRKQHYIYIQTWEIWHAWHISFHSLSMPGEWPFCQQGQGYIQINYCFRDDVSFVLKPQSSNVVCSNDLSLNN